ncbi:MAG: ABC transporter permease [bacterium]|nr:ABC transporter permease [bacterium]
MIGLQTVATPVGLLIGIVCGFVPLIIGIRQKQYVPALLGWVACALSGFACGWLGGLPMIVLATSVVISYSHTVKSDPFLSREALENIDFTETTAERIVRQMAALGRTIRGAMRALLRNKAGFLGFIGMMFFFLMTVFGPTLIPYDGQAHFYDRLLPGAQTLFRPPSWEFPLGLDYQGRDILSHIVHGGQKIIITAFQAGVMTSIVAVALGSLAALLGGWIDRGLVAIANFILTIPQFPLLVVLAAIIEIDNRFFLALLLAALDWPGLMRAVRAQVLSLRERDYVQAAISLDLGLWHIITREVLPNMISYIVISTIFSVRAAMYSLVALVVLGFVPLSEPDWGLMIFLGNQQGSLFSRDALMMVLAPVMAIALFQLSLVMFTRSLEEVFNPRLRAGL